MAKNIVFLDFFVLMKDIYEIEQAKNRYLHKVDTMSLHLIIIRPFAQFWIVNMTSVHSCSEGFVQKPRHKGTLLPSHSTYGASQH